jgi:hypothetical protein
MNNCFPPRSLLKSLGIILGLFLCFATNPARATDPRVHWEQIETPHFVIIFDSKQRFVGELYAHFAEQAFVGVSPTFGLWPNKTAIIIDDSTDSANGSATFLPYPIISAYPVLPTSLDTIGDYGDWGFELLSHEYTHILTFEPRNGIMRPLSWIFGSIVRPNGLLPRWYLEGLAVEMETRYTNFGRLRSANNLSTIRAMVEEKTLRYEDIARINDTSIPDWQGGNRAYLMGALLWDEMVRMKGDAIIGELNLDYSRRVPFFINAPVKSRLGLDYAALLSKTYDRAEQNALKQIEIIQKAGKEDEEPLEQTGYFNQRPVISPDGTKLAFVGRDHNVPGFISITERPEAKAGAAFGSFVDAEKNTVIKSDGVSNNINRVSWTPDSKSLIYDGIDNFQRYTSYSDLWRIDVETKEKTQLTHALRAREPAVSPDGKLIVFVQNTPASTRLASVRIDGSNIRILYTPPIQTRVSQPEFLSNGEVIFSEKQKDGSEIFKTLKMVGHKPEIHVVLKDFAPVHYPRLTKEGLLFVSDRSGIANLYLADRDLKTARAVTNTTTRILPGELDPKTGDLIYSRLMADGPVVVSTPRSSWEKVPAIPPQVGPLVDSQFPQYKEPEVITDNKVEDYSPFSYLIPRYWVPYFAIIPYGTYYSASTSASDPAGRDGYSLSTSYDTLTNRPSFFGQYVHLLPAFGLTFNGQDYYEYIYDGSFPRHSTLGSVQGSTFLPGLSNDWKGLLGLQYYQTQLLGTTLVRTGIQSAISWSNARQRGLEISPGRGGSTTLGYTRYLSGLGNIEYDQTEFRGAYYFSKWLPERHAIAVFGNAFVAPRLTNALFGQTTTNGVYQISPNQRGFVMRGYGPGEFIGSNMLQGTLEYRFPLLDSYRGYGTAPFFFQRWHGALFVDALGLDGYSFNYTNSTYQTNQLGRQIYVGTGAEIKCDTTLFYQIPVQLILGLYYGADAATNPYGLFPFIGFGL